jgi:RNA polymerase sigma-70 factor (ECF subfamily)
LERLHQGDPSARDELIAISQERLRLLTRRILRGYPDLGRWEQTDDVLQNVLLRLERSLREVQLASTLDFLRLAAALVRRELIDLVRHHFGPLGWGANHATPDRGRPAGPTPAGTSDAGDLQLWGEVHQQIAALPDEERQTFDLLWYQGLTQPEAAALLGVSLRTLKRRWQAARVLLAQALGGDFTF